MPKEYIAKGTLTLSGVDFFIAADNQEEAEAKARRGEWDYYDISGASSDDCEIGQPEENV